jgi:hypothetical protein
MFDVDTDADRSVLERMNHLSAATKVFEAREANGKGERDELSEQKE